MTEKLDCLSKALYFQSVPKLWIAASYPSKLGLGHWLQDLGLRISSTRQWVEKGPPVLFNIATFYKPQGFLKASLRVAARALHVRDG